MDHDARKKENLYSETAQKDRQTDRHKELPILTLNGCHRLQPMRDRSGAPAFRIDNRARKF